ncbi:MAG: hypothetical protein QM734_07875 [Cyclobacteriaceae bacterium]
MWNDFVYEYDSKGNLVYVTEKRKTDWTRQNNEPRERHVIEYKTKLENDNRGFVRLKSVYSEKDDNPILCYFYDYVYRKN